MKITEGLYAYIWRSMFENNCNMYYFGEPLNILFDPGLKNYLDVRTLEMSKDGLDISKTAYVVNTHGHPDHIEGSIDFINKNMSVGIHREEIEFIKEKGAMFFNMMGMKFDQLKFAPVLEEGKWKVGETELEVFHTPGHSPGSICIYWPEKKALVCGDLMFEGSVGRVDFPGGNGELLKDSITRMSKLDVEILLPGHMNFVKGKAAVKANFDFIIKNYFPMM